MNVTIKLLLTTFWVTAHYALGHVIVKDNPHFHKRTLEEPNLVALQQTLLPLSYNVIPNVLLKHSHQHPHQNLILQPPSVLVNYPPLFQLLLPNNYFQYPQSPLVEVSWLDDDLDEYDLTDEERELFLHHHLNSDLATLTLPNYQPGNFLINPKLRLKKTKIGEDDAVGLKLKGLYTDKNNGTVKEYEENTTTVVAESQTVIAPVENV